MEKAAPPPPVKPGDLINHRYLVQDFIGSGAFGDVFVGQDLMDKGKRVAIKVDRTGARNPFSQLHVENMILTHLKGGKLNRMKNVNGGFPKPHYFGVHNESVYVLVMDLLGSNLENLFTNCGRKFSLRTILLIADQLIYRLQYLHEKGYIHRDVKPDNIVMGMAANGRDVVHLIDFGLTMTYWVNRKTKTHIKDNRVRTEAGRGVGTSRYMSVRSHYFRQGSRRDDMESLAYVLAYFLKGELPWQNVQATTVKQKLKKIAEIKNSITPEQLFQGCPQGFTEFLKCVKQLKFDEEPNYRMYQRLLRKEGKNLQIVYWKGGQFDWTLVDGEKMRN